MTLLAPGWHLRREDELWLIILKSLNAPLRCRRRLPTCLLLCGIRTTCPATCQQGSRQPGAVEKRPESRATPMATSMRGKALFDPARIGDGCTGAPLATVTIPRG